MCWLAGFWVFFLRAFLCPKQKIVGIHGVPNCDLGELVPPFWHPWDLFWRLEGTLGDLGGSKKDNGDPGSTFIDFGMVLEAHFGSFSGTEG